MTIKKLLAGASVAALLLIPSLDRAGVPPRRELTLWEKFERLKSCEATFPFTSPMAMARTRTAASRVFKVVTWTGDGTTPRKFVGVGFSPDLVWIKERGGTTQPLLFDTTRGAAGGYLGPQGTSGQSGSATYLTSFDADGFTVSNVSPGINDSGKTYVAWCFKKAAGFFDIVTYTGNATNRTIAHSLGVVPGWMLVKRSTGTGSWYMYHAGLGGTKGVQFEGGNAPVTSATYWNNSSHSTTTFSLGTGVTNTSTQTFIAYLWADDPSGIIDSGTLTTDASGNATITTGWQPQFIFIYLTTTGVTYAIDATRGFTAALYIDLTLINAETSSGVLTVTATPTGVAFHGANSTQYTYTVIRT